MVSIFATNLICLSFQVLHCFPCSSHAYLCQCQSMAMAELKESTDCSTSFSVQYIAGSLLLGTIGCPNKTYWHFHESYCGMLSISATDIIKIGPFVYPILFSKNNNNKNIFILSKYLIIFRTLIRAWSVIYTQEDPATKTKTRITQNVKYRHKNLIKSTTSLTRLESQVRN